jgi:cyclopropane fatty-acyl-phospholipid synthase-like methyltransferase
MSSLPGHLGGHKGRSHVDQGTLEYLKNEFNIKSMLDIGCGPGGMVKLGRELGLETYGIDGDFTVDRDIEVTIHDYNTGSSSLDVTVDLIWSVEFLEHVYEQYQDNYMQDFIKGKYALITFAPPGKPGHHHVNCKNPEYWIEVFKKYGFEYDEERTKHIREISTMFTTKKNKKTGELMKRHQFVKENGMLFVKV